MITGIITGILFLIECSLGLWKKVRGKKGSMPTAIKCHRIIGVLTVIAAVLHLVLTLGLWKQRPLSVYLWGIAAFLSIAAASALGLGKMNKKRLKYHRILAAAAVLSMGIHIYGAIVSMTNYKKAVQQIAISDIDITAIPDGVYQGECSVQYIYAQVQVTVSGGKLEQIKLLQHRHERGGAAEQIINDITAQNNLNVDAVSGATNSSKVIKKAIENALRSPRK